jgi:hypothetical protein
MASEKRLRAAGAEEIAACVHGSNHGMFREGGGVSLCLCFGSALVSRLQRFKAWNCMPSVFRVFRVSGSSLSPRATEDRIQI